MAAIVEAATGIARGRRLRWAVVSSWFVWRFHGHAPIGSRAAAVTLTSLARFGAALAVTGGGKEALFFRLEDSDEALCGTGLDKASDSGAVEDGAIVYAKLANG